jgi:hypothetical protein
MMIISRDDRYFAVVGSKTFVGFIHPAEDSLTAQVFDQRVDEWDSLQGVFDSMKISNFNYVETSLQINYPWKMPACGDDLEDFIEKYPEHFV